MQEDGVARLEVGGVRQIRHNVDIRQRLDCDGAVRSSLKRGKAFVYLTVCTEGERRCNRNCVCVVTAAAGAAVLLRRILAQGIVQRVQNLCGFLVVALDNKIQLVGLRSGQVVTLLLHILHNGFVLLLLRTGKQRFLVRSQRRIRSLEVLDGLLHRLCACDLAGVIGQHGKILAETA